MRTRREDRFRYEDRPYSNGRFEHDAFMRQRDDRDRFFDEEDHDRGWFDRVRDTASRWLHGRDDDDDRLEAYRVAHDDDEDRRRFIQDESRRFIQDEIDRRRFLRARDDERRYRDYEDRMLGRDRFARGWDDDRDERDRDEENYRVRQFASYGRDDDDRSPQFNRQHGDRGTLGRRGDFGPHDRGPRRHNHADERDRWTYSSRDDDWRDRYVSERPRYPIGNVHDQRLAYDRERERFERHRDDRYRMGDRDYTFDRDDDGFHRRRQFEPLEHEDVRRGISRFHDRDRRR